MSSEDRKKGLHRSSTAAWVNQYLNRENTLRQLVDGMDTLDKRVSLRPHELQLPINILCFDGGAMRAFALAGMIQELKEVGGSGDYLRYFDLVAGTSVGGFAALNCSYFGDVDDVYHSSMTSLAAGQDGIADFSFTKLLREGTLVANDMRRDVFTKCLGNGPLFNSDPNHLKGFAVCARRVKEDDAKANRKGIGGKKKTNRDTWKPYLARTYRAQVQEEYREVSADASSDFLEQPETFLPGVLDISLVEGCIATTAAPVAFDRFSVQPKGEETSIRFGDGCVISNNPVAIALQEARALWPHRPIGIVLSLGLIDDHEAELNLAAIERVREHNPDLTYVRLDAPLGDKSYLFDNDVESSQKTERIAREFIRNSEAAKNIMEKLRASPSRRDPDARKQEKPKRETDSFRSSESLA